MSWNRMRHPRHCEPARNWSFTPTRAGSTGVEAVGFLSGKRALIVGLATERSIAYGIASAMKREGGTSPSPTRTIA